MKAQLGPLWAKISSISFYCSSPLGTDYSRSFEAFTALDSISGETDPPVLWKRKTAKRYESLTETHPAIPLTLQPLYTGMSLSVPSGGFRKGVGTGSKRPSMAAASSAPISLELRLLCVHSSTQYLLEYLVSGPAALMLTSLVRNSVSITSLPSKTRQASLIALKVS